MNIKNILEGWKLYLNNETLSEHVREIAEKRAAICHGCEHFVHSNAWSVVNRLVESVSDTVKLSKKDVSSKTCDLCHCNFPAKFLVMNESCPIGLWGSEENAG